eukprot:CAMPEP_0206429552 /NCGR_PEP_ID=MMETSP0324_2-20121206/6308_1 /ASSEMBLY_ACC=CAM_ASM_000836 /TAXON_ID=2866 /ORGANISM="Crypthecodinium cohnii, Strain Seligo" /LENGTH=80 /DNA_ID=CAMNT_0053895253 /DNA_START=330 /DNA_END=573 /DNA_ORIENTATION=-
MTVQVLSAALREASSGILVALAPVQGPVPREGSREVPQLWEKGVKLQACEVRGQLRDVDGVRLDILQVLEFDVFSDSGKR